MSISSEPRSINTDFWRNKKVLVTGHTGFKGSWLSLLLLHLGCDVYGFSCSYPSDPCLFKQLKLENKLTHVIGDIRNQDHLKQFVIDVHPDVVFHLAAQPLVLESYRSPVDTWSVNVNGTINVMESLRRLSTPCTAVFITTDKVYLNKEWFYSYRESDPLGGHDPYSSSKAAAELAIASWRLSYFHHQHPTINIVSARSGNVIGGGDWSPDRLIPDIIRSLINQRDIVIRHPNSTRPWQHVLDPLAGYIFLAESLNSSSLNHSAYNFGPSSDGNRTVSDLVQEVFRTWPGSWFVEEPPDTMHEANLLNLATDLAHHDLSWFPRWGFSESISRTTNWYKQVCSNSLSPFEACMLDLKDYLSHSQKHVRS